MNDSLAILVLCAPLLAALVNGLSLFAGDRHLHWRSVQNITVGATLVSLVGSLALLVSALLDPAPRRVFLYEWITSGDMVIRVGLLVDVLSALMAVVVTGFAFVIGRFSTNYMHREPGFTRYFSAYALFVFAMLVLVLGDNYVMLFVGWEAVGVCSYLLIGQYYDRTSSARASTEAFIANRVGDAAFVIGLLILFNQFGSVDYAEVAAKAGQVERGYVIAVTLCLLLGAIGKSAQLPLGSWLAKAMEGPTPSSALIHAATMVTAGVYLIVRSQELYNAVPEVLMVVALVGAATALYGALVGQSVSDIKGLLATSTTTQLGFMFLACGLGAYAVAMFHLVAHAFYKSYLFLTAPSILHHLHGRLDPARQETETPSASLYTVAALAGGLLVALPMLLSLVPGGVPLLGGQATTWLVVAGGLVALGSAAHYAYELTRRAFAEHGGHQEHEGQPDGHEKRGADAAALPQAGPVLWPLGLIALAACAGVALQVFPAGVDNSWFQAVMAPVLRPAADAAGAAPALRVALTLVLVAMVAFAWFTAVNLGRFRAEASLSLRQWRWLYVATLNRFWLDAFTQRVLVAGAQRIGRALDRFDGGLLARIVAAPGGIALRIGRVVEWLDTRARAAGESGPGALAAHLGRVAALLERYLINGIESLLGFGTALFARVGAGFERAVAKPAVAVALIGLILALSFIAAR